MRGAIDRPGGRPFDRAMSMTLDPRALTQAGAQALGRGDFAAARALFEQIVAAGRADAPVWLGLAVALRGLGEAEAKLAALERLLALEPRHLRGLVMKADHFAEAGDGRAAAAFYRAAVKSAPAMDRLPAELRAEVERARAAGGALRGRVRGATSARDPGGPGVGAVR